MLAVTRSAGRQRIGGGPHSLELFLTRQAGRAHFGPVEAPLAAIGQHRGTVTTLPTGEGQLDDRPASLISRASSTTSAPKLSSSDRRLWSPHDHQAAGCARPTDVEIAHFLRYHSWYHVSDRYSKMSLHVRCPNPHQESNPVATGKLAIDDGSYYCLTCRARWNWATFTAHVSERSPVKQTKRAASKFYEAYPDVERYRDNLQALPEEDIQALEKSTGITRSTLKYYGVGQTTRPVDKLAQSVDSEYPLNHRQEKPYITFPRTGIQQNPIIVRLRLVPYELDDVSVRDVKGAIMDPPGEPVSPGLFGLHTVKQDQARLVICGNDIDAMAVYQGAKQPAVALDRYNQLPLSVLPLLQRFVRIDLWLEDSPLGRAATLSHAEKLGVHRTWIVNNRNAAVTVPTPAEALRSGHNLVEILDLAEKPTHKDVLRFSDVRRVVHQQILFPELTRGVLSTILPELNDVLKGLRRGELTIITGATGIGKTTVLSHLSLDYAANDVPTVWGSFEIPNQVLVRKMLDQMAGKPLVRHAGAFDKWADKFEELPMYFLDYFGSTKLENVLKALSHAVYANDAGLVVIDNLQFMLSGQVGSNNDKWLMQDTAVHALRRFATEKNVHVMLVVHPRKENNDLDISSVYGSVKVTQEADNVIILQQRLGWNFIEVMKQRYDGTLGKIGYVIDKESKALRGLEFTEKECFEQVLSRPGVMQRGSSSQ